MYRRKQAIFKYNIRSALQEVSVPSANLLKLYMGVPLLISYK